MDFQPHQVDTKLFRNCSNSKTDKKEGNVNAAIKPATRIYYYKDDKTCLIVYPRL